MKILHPKEIATVLNLPAKKRYEYFIKEVVNWDNVWGLYDSDWITIIDKDGYKLFPVWPHKKYAELFLQENYKISSPKSVDVDDFAENFLIKLGEKNTAIWVFPTSEKAGFIVCYQTLYNDIHEEFSKY